MPAIKSSADLRNNYNEISTFCHNYPCLLYTSLLTFIVFIEEERCSQSIVCPFHYYGSYFSFAIDVWIKLLYPCRSLYNSNTCNRKYFG